MMAGNFKCGPSAFYKALVGAKVIGCVLAGLIHSLNPVFCFVECLGAPKAAER